MSELFKVDLTKPLPDDFLEALSNNKESYRLQFKEMCDTEKGTSRVNFDEVLSGEDSEFDIFKGPQAKVVDEIEMLTHNLVLLGNKIVSIEQLGTLSVYCEEVIRTYSLKAPQKCRLFAAFAGIIYSLDKIYCQELHDRVVADLVVPYETNDDFIAMVQKFSEIEAEVYMFYKDYVDSPETFREYFTIKRDNINRVYEALLYAGN